MDTVITLGDIKLPAGVTAVADPETAIVTVLVTREEELPEAEAAEGEVGAAGEGDSEAAASE